MKAVDANRRRVLKAVAAATMAATAPGLAACARADTLDRGLVFTSLDEALREVDRLVPAQRLRSSTAWDLPQTIAHCAQSIEFSVSGFPQARSPLFQNTIGGAAFNVFAWRGRMSHDLTAPIPGAPAVGELEVLAAVARLHAAVRSFRDAASLQPHFAYGMLDRTDYERAHAMHLANHLSAFEVEAVA